MFNQKILSILVLLTLLSACGDKEVSKANAPKEATKAEKALVVQYMDFLQAGDTASAKSLYCYPEQFSESPTTDISAITTYEMGKGSNLFANPNPDIQSLQNPELTYTRAKVIANPEAAGRAVIDISVWDTNNHYQAAQAEDAEWKAIGGEPKFSSDRTMWASTPLCVDDTDMHGRNKRLTTGLTKAEVQDILGSPGELVGGNTYRWKIPTSRSASEVSFTNGKASVIKNLMSY